MEFFQFLGCIAVRTILKCNSPESMIDILLAAHEQESDDICLGSGGQFWASHQGGKGSNPGQFMWD